MRFSHRMHKGHWLFTFSTSLLDVTKTTILKIGKPNYQFLETALCCHSKMNSWTSQASSEFLGWASSGSKLWQNFHFDLTHSPYTANPLTVSKYFWRGWRGEFGYFIFTKPTVMAGVREYSRKLGRFFKPTASIISFTLFSSVPIATSKRFIFSDNVDAVSSKLVWVLVWVLVWGPSVSLYPISI